MEPTKNECKHEHTETITTGHVAVNGDGTVDDNRDEKLLCLDCWKIIEAVPQATGEIVDIGI